jgi:hypothetical protein
LIIKSIQLIPHYFRLNIQFHSKINNIPILIL